MSNEWPKWVNGRIAHSPVEAEGLLSHAQDCGIHTTIITGNGLFRPRHPDHPLACTCGGVVPTDADLEAAGLSRFNGAPAAAFDHDQDGKPGGAPKGGNRKKAAAAG
jgi:hypothetical protein